MAELTDALDINVFNRGAAQPSCRTCAGRSEAILGLRNSSGIPNNCSFQYSK